MMGNHTRGSAQRLALTGAGAGVDSAWEQKKLEARKMSVNRAREASHKSAARFVRGSCCAKPRLFVLGCNYHFGFMVSG